MRTALILLLTTYFFGALSPALGASVLVTPGKADADDVQVNDGDELLVSFEAGRSYECSVTQKMVAASTEFVTFALEAKDPDNSIITLSAVGNHTPRIAAPAGKSSLRSRVSLVAEKTGTYTLLFDVNQPGFATVRCNETSLSGDFNTFFAPTPILELVNLTSSEITATLTVTDFTGNPLLDEADREVTIAANARLDTVLSSIAPNLYGQVQVSYVGAYGALRGTMAEYQFGSDSIELKRERPLRARSALP